MLSLNSFDLNLLNYSLTHLICICHHLVNQEDYENLERFLISIPTLAITSDFLEHYHYAWVYLYAAKQQYDDVYGILTSTQFSKQYFKKLQNLWYECHYKEQEKIKNKKLNPVEKYRLRKKFPPPKTISNGEKTIYNFFESSITRLYNFFEQIKYPDLQQRKNLANETCLTMNQINNWFKNKRQRLKKAFISQN